MGMNFIKDFKVSVPSAFYLEYSEGEHMMRLDMDFRDEFPILCHRAILAWEPPFADEPVSDAKKREILANIIFYLNEVRRFKFEVDGGSFAESREYKS
jgi:hypothetical protein